MYEIDSTFLVIWGLATVFMGFVWTARGRSFLQGSMLSLGLSPVLSLVILLLTGDGQKRVQCPSCKERVIVGATTCPHCRSSLLWAGSRPVLP